MGSREARPRMEMKRDSKHIGATTPCREFSLARNGNIPYGSPKKDLFIRTGLFLFLTKKGIRTGGQSQIYTKYEFMLFNLRPNATGFAFATQA